MYLVLEDGAPSFPQGASDPVVLGILLELIQISRTGLSPSTASLPMLFHYLFKSHVGVPQPQQTSLLVWTFPVSLAATQGISARFLFLWVLRWFSSPGLPPAATLLTTG